jgi:hypothetical protein
LLYTTSYLVVFNQRNVRDVAGDWINHNIAPGERIGLSQYPAPYRTPPFAFYRYNLIPLNWDKKLLDKTRPKYFLFSEYEAQLISTDLLNSFLKDYRLWKKFEKPARIAGLKFERTGFSAKDWWQPNPYILIFKRKN